MVTAKGIRKKLIHKKKHLIIGNVDDSHHHLFSPGTNPLSPEESLFPASDVRWYRITSFFQLCPLLATAKINPLCSEPEQVDIFGCVLSMWVLRDAVMLANG